MIYALKIKKNLTKLILINLFILGFFNANLNYCYSEERKLSNAAPAAAAPAANWATNSKITITVTEPIPWLDCSWWWNWYKKTYKCTVDKSFWSVLKMLEWIVKYITFIIILIAILMLIISWIRISIEWNKDDAKKQFKRVIWWIVLLFLVWFILNSIAPWFYGL